MLKALAKYLVLSEETLTLWHGGDLETFQEAVSHKKGRWEFGPGLYLTTHYDTARKYSKGSRKLYKVVVKKGTDIREVDLQWSIIDEFISVWVIKKKLKEVTERLRKFRRNDKVNADIFVNVIVNEEAIKNVDTDKLRNFLVANGVDYSIQDSAFGWHERMLVLFNMKNIVSKTIVKPSDKIDEFDLPVDFN